MKKFVRIYHYPTRTEKVKEFINEDDARDYFIGFSNEHNLEYQEYDGAIEESGGIGHDYNVELIDERLIEEGVVVFPSGKTCKNENFSLSL